MTASPSTTVPGSCKAAAVRSDLSGWVARRWGVFCPIIAQIPDSGLQNMAWRSILQCFVAEKITFEQLEHITRVNFEAPLYLISRAVPYMKKNKLLQIVDFYFILFYHKSINFVIIIAREVKV